MGYLIGAGLISLGMIPKAALEAGYFQDRKAAKRTLYTWVLSMSSIALSFGFTLLIDHLG